MNFSQLQPCFAQTSYMCIPSPLKTAIFSRESRRKVMASSWNNWKSVKKEWVIIIEKLLLYFSSKRWQSKNQLHFASHFTIKSLVALDPAQWTASSTNQLWALCCHCWPLNTAAGCRKTSTLPQSQSHWSAAASCPAAAIQISTAGAAVAPTTTDQGLYLTAITTVLFNVLSFSSFLHLMPHMFAWAGFLISLCTAQIVHLSLN